MPNHIKELPFLPPGTKVKMRKDLTEGIEYGQYYFVEGMNCEEVTIKHYNATYKTYSIIGNTYKYTLEMFDQVINNLKENNNMETKEIKIKVPKGYEIDEENSTYECIKLKPIKKELTYEDVVEELFSNSYYYTNGRGEIIIPTGLIAKEDKNNAINKRQLERLLALNQLLNITEYYNKKSPKEGNEVYCINFDERNKNTEYFVGKYTRPMIVRGLIPMFNRHEDVSAVIYNPNFKEILDLIYKDDEN